MMIAFEPLMMEAARERWILALLVLLCLVTGAVIPLVLLIARALPSAEDSRRCEQAVLRLGEARGRQAVLDEVRMLAHGQMKPHVLAVQRCLVLARDATTDAQRAHWTDAGIHQIRRLLDVVVMLYQAAGTSVLPDDLEHMLVDVAQSLTVAYPSCHCRVEVYGQRPAAIGDSLQRALMLVCYNALHNAYVHGGPSQVTVQVQYAPDALMLVVDDDGLGMTAIPRGSGRGLRDIRALVAAHGGTIQITSRPGAGTRLCATVPLEETDQTIGVWPDATCSLHASIDHNHDSSTGGALACVDSGRPPADSRLGTRYAGTAPD